MTDEAAQEKRQIAMFQVSDELLFSFFKWFAEGAKFHFPDGRVVKMIGDGLPKDAEFKSCNFGHSTLFVYFSSKENKAIRDDEVIPCIEFLFDTQMPDPILEDFIDIGPDDEPKSDFEHSTAIVDPFDPSKAKYLGWKA